MLDSSTMFSLHRALGCRLSYASATIIYASTCLSNSCHVSDRAHAFMATNNSFECLTWINVRLLLYYLQRWTLMHDKVDPPLALCKPATFRPSPSIVLSHDRAPKLGTSRSSSSGPSVKQTLTHLSESTPFHISTIHPRP